MDVGVFKFLVVGLDARRMNEVCNINYRLFYYNYYYYCYYYHYYYYYYYHINFAKCNDISVIFEFFCVIYICDKKNNCIDFICRRYFCVVSTSKCLITFLLPNDQDGDVKTKQDNVSNIL